MRSTHPLRITLLRASGRPRTQTLSAWPPRNYSNRLVADVSNQQLDSPDRQPKQCATITNETGRHSPIFTSAARLSGRTCMITGGSSGIGFAIAERFLQEGSKRVVLIGRSYPRLLSAASRLESAAGAPTAAAEEEAGNEVATRDPEEDRIQGSEYVVHERAKGEGVNEGAHGVLIAVSERVSVLVGDVSSVESWARELEKEMETVDILVNAAGISLSNLLPKTDPADISRTLRTNLEGALLTSRAFLRASVRNRLKNRNKTDSNAAPPSKCIINISSLLTQKGGTGAVPYAASKAGLLGLTRSLAVEAAETLRGVVVRSNVIVPGYIETPMIEDMHPDELARLKQSIPLKRFGDPQEVADAAVFLAQNDYANNCVLNLDGGLSAI